MHATRKQEMDIQTREWISELKSISIRLSISPFSYPARCGQPRKNGLLIAYFKQEIIQNILHMWQNSLEDIHNSLTKESTSNPVELGNIPRKGRPLSETQVQRNDSALLKSNQKPFAYRNSTWSSHFRNNKKIKKPTHNAGPDFTQKYCMNQTDSLEHPVTLSMLQPMWGVCKVNVLFLVCLSPGVCPSNRRDLSVPVSSIAPTCLCAHVTGDYLWQPRLPSLPPSTASLKKWKCHKRCFRSTLLMKMYSLQLKPGPCSNLWVPSSYNIAVTSAKPWAPVLYFWRF